MTLRGRRGTKRATGGDPLLPPARTRSLGGYYVKEEECGAGGTAAFYGHFPLLHDSLYARHISLSLCCAALPLLIKVGKAHRGPIQGSDLYSVDALLQGLLIDRDREEWRSTEIGLKACLFAKLQPGRARKRINTT